MAEAAAAAAPLAAPQQSSTQPTNNQTAASPGSGLQQIIESLGVPHAPQKPLSVEARDAHGTLIAGVYG